MAGGQQDNVPRLRAFIRVFGLSIQDVADAGRVSRPLVSGLLAGKPNIKANGLFLMLERNLCGLVAKRGHPFFSLDGIPVERAEEAARLDDGAAGWLIPRQESYFEEQSRC